MKNSSFEKLKNPPIKETVIGIGINNYFSGDLKNTPLYNELVKIYPKTIPTYNTDISIVDGKIQNTNNDICGYCFQSEEGKESTFVAYNRIAFVDRNRYESFDIFFNKFKKIFNLIQESKPVKKCTQIVLKHVNQIFLEQSELSTPIPKIKFLPNFNTKTKTNTTAQWFAQLSRFSGSYIIQSVKNTQIKSFIDTSLQFVGNPPRLQVLFIIDTVVDVNNDLNALSNLEDYMSQLRDFKNTIFFENVERDIKVFSK
ncbi:MAG: TIGR04255 family protein [Endomicrobium sp.]|jgi:uncharacterized protein (TIGR04255 family)|nr:TIGR04255 family protein [Endomicrobium sp.]